MRKLAPGKNPETVDKDGGRGFGADLGFAVETYRMYVENETRNQHPLSP